MSIAYIYIYIIKRKHIGHIHKKKTWLKHIDNVNYTKSLESIHMSTNNNLYVYIYNI